MPTIIAAQGIGVLDQSRQNVSKTPSQPTSQMWWYLPMVPTTAESIGRRIAVQAYLKNKVEEVGVWLTW
jgi:hypothetical protein